MQSRRRHAAFRLAPAQRAAGWLATLLLSCAAGCEDEPSSTSHAGPVPSQPKRAEPLEPRSAEGDAIEHTLRFPDPASHRVVVESAFPVNEGEPLELMMAVWIPGSYKIRDYSRFVRDFRASTPDGKPLDVEKTRKNRWRVEPAEASHVVVRYRLYAHERSVRHNLVDDTLAMLNGAPTFVVPVEQLDRPHDVKLELPDSWSESVTQLAPHPKDGAHRYLAPSYAMLVDSPIVAGNPATHRFEVAGTPHTLVLTPRSELWEGERSATDVKAIVRAHRRFWGRLPHDRYWFLNMLVESGGGLEHMRSTLMMASRWDTRARDDYLDWLSLVSHEFFHTWNVKRLRPRALKQYDYERENYTRSLWIVEGITSYYDDLLLRRAGRITQAEYLERLSDSIEDVQNRPGRRLQSLSEASFDAWIKYYKRHEGSANSTISYYDKGAVVAFLLDTRIRTLTDGESSLREVMRVMYDRYADSGYRPGQFRSICNEIAGEPLDEFFARYIDDTADLDFEPALKWYGLQFEPRPDAADGGTRDGSTESDNGDEARVQLGVTLRHRSGRTVVRSIRRGGPAQRAGVSPGDELIAIDGYRIPQDALQSRLSRYRPGERVELLIARRGEIRRLDTRLAKGRRRSWQLQPNPDANAAQRARRKRWLRVTKPQPSSP